MRRSRAALGYPKHGVSTGPIIVLAVGALAVVGGFVGVVLATSGGDDKLTIYTARSHYGEEAPFKSFAEDDDVNLTLFGGSASELYERLRSEGDNTKADALITVDAANLYRAEAAGLLAENRDPEVEKHVPANLRDPKGRWYGITVRARTIMRSTDRVKPDAVTTYAGLGDQRWKGKLCLRSGTSEYNISFVADRIAKDGAAKTKAMLKRWMANDPTILGSDTDVLKSISSGGLRCRPDQLVLPGPRVGGGRGLPGGAGVGRSERPRHALEPVGHRRREGRRQGRLGQAAGALPDRSPPSSACSRRTTTSSAWTRWPTPRPRSSNSVNFKQDPIDVAGAGKHLGDAVQMMNSVGWE